MANDIIGTGPRLQLLTEDADANRQIEQAFNQWTKAVGLPENLRTLRMAHGGTPPAEPKKTWLPYSVTRTWHVQTLVDSVLKAEEHLQAIGVEQSIEEVVADKGYHAADTLELCDSLGLRTYFPEPKRKSDWNWTERTPEHQRAVYGNHRRVKRAKGKQLQRRRSELCERSFAHVCETGRMRRTWLTGSAT